MNTIIPELNRLIIEHIPLAESKKQLNAISNALHVYFDNLEELIIKDAVTKVKELKLDEKYINSKYVEKKTDLSSKTTKVEAESIKTTINNQSTSEDVVANDNIDADEKTSLLVKRHSITAASIFKNTPTEDPVKQVEVTNDEEKIEYPDLFSLNPN